MISSEPITRLQVFGADLEAQTSDWELEGFQQPAFEDYALLKPQRQDGDYRRRCTELESKLKETQAKLDETKKALDMETAVRTSIQKQYVKTMSTVNPNTARLVKHVQSLTKENKTLKVELREERRKSSEAVSRLRKLLRLATSS